MVFNWVAGHGHYYGQVCSLIWWARSLVYSCPVVVNFVLFFCRCLWRTPHQSAEMRNRLFCPESMGGFLVNFLKKNILICVIFCASNRREKPWNVLRRGRLPTLLGQNTLFWDKTHSFGTKHTHLQAKQLSSRTKHTHFGQNTFFWDKTTFSRERAGGEY